MNEKESKLAEILLDEAINAKAADERMSCVNQYTALLDAVTRRMGCENPRVPK